MTYKTMTLDQLAARIRNKNYLRLYDLTLLFPTVPVSKLLTQQQEKTQTSPVQPSESTPKKPGTK